MPNDRIIVDPDLGDDLGYRPVGQAPKGNNHFNDEVITLHSQLLMPAIPKSYFNQQTFKTQGFNLKDPQVDQIQRLINARRPNAKPLVIDGDYGPLTQTALNQCACVECPPPTGGPDKATLYSLLKGEVSGQKKSVQTEDLTTANLPVWSLTLEEKFVQTLHLVISKLPMELENAVKDMLSPAAIAMIAGVMVIWAGSHVFGVGFAVDAVMLVSGVVFLGLEVWDIADDFGDYLSKTAAAETQAQLDEASNHLARIIVVLGVEVFMVVIAKASGRNARAARKEAEVQLKPQDRKTDGLDEVATVEGDGVDGYDAGAEVVADDASNQISEQIDKTVDELIDSDLDLSNSLNGLEGEAFKNNALTNYYIDPNVVDLTRDEYLSLHVYTTNLYDPINSGLRGLSPSDQEKWSNVSADADSALAKLSENSELRYEGEAFRGDSFSDELLNDLFPVGGVHQDAGFKSSSYSPESAFPGNTTTVIVSKTGVKINDISVAEAEKEVLFRPGTKFRVMSREEVDGHNYIKLEEL